MASVIKDLSKLAITGVRAVGTATLEGTIGFFKGAAVGAREGIRAGGIAAPLTAMLGGAVGGTVGAITGAADGISRTLGYTETPSRAVKIPIAKPEPEIREPKKDHPAEYSGSPSTPSVSKEAARPGFQQIKLREYPPKTTEDRESLEPYNDVT
jgi:hypothetical protein